MIEMNESKLHTIAQIREFREVTIQDTGEALWSGGADLTVPFFSPPLLITTGGRPFFLNEETQNIGNIPKKTKKMKRENEGSGLNTVRLDRFLP